MDVDGCPLPDDRLYDIERDVWLKPDPADGTATLGVTSVLASFAGRFVSIGFRPIEGVQALGRSVATVESVRYTGAVRLPVDAEVVERNRSLEARPRTINDAPYEQGWIARIRPFEPVRPGSGLAPAPEVREALRRKVAEWRVHCYPAMPDQELYEIGAECQAILARLDEALQQRPPGEVTLLVTDDATSPLEMVRWSDRTGHSVLHHRVDGNLHHFLVRREERPVPRRRRADGSAGR
ncbi:MAG: hypothetical protein L3K19_02010 [Thermoplasmata archaeon]|nr:hypothetical protein [Thermoplasmata archaeon]